MSFEHPRGKLNRNKIVEAIIQLGGVDVSPSQIKERLNENAIRLVKHQCEYLNISMSEAKKNARIKELNMSETAMFSGLKILTDQRILLNDNGRYSIHDKMKSDIRHFAPIFGESALSHMMEMHYPTINTAEENLDKLIKIFGVHTICHFIEAARPVSDINIDKKYNKIDKTMTNFEKDKLASTYVQNVFPILNMYDYFYSIFENQPSDDDIKKTLRKENFKENEDDTLVFVKRLPSAQQLTFERFKVLTSVKSSYKKRKEEKPLYELDEKVLKRLEQYLKTNPKYAPIYEQFFEAKAFLLGRPKEQSLSEQRKKQKNQALPSLTDT
jgi:hypothetical protein